MTLSKLVVFARNNNCCGLSKRSFNIVVRTCTGREVIASGILQPGMEFDAHVPPGCYIVGSKKGDYNLHPTMVIVPCDKTVCVNLIEEGDYDTVALAPEVATGNESTGDKVQL